MSIIYNILNIPGIVNPVDVKLRPSKMGLGHRGFDERTDAVINAAEKMKDSTMITPAKTRTKAWAKDSNSYNIPSNLKKSMKIKAKTLDLLIAEQEELSGLAENIQPSIIIDMTGKETKKLSSLSDYKFSESHSTTQSLPELRYNTRIITDLTYSDIMEKTRLLRITVKSQEVFKKDAQLSLNDSQLSSTIAVHSELIHILKECQGYASKSINCINQSDLVTILKELEVPFKRLESDFSVIYRLILFIIHS